MLHRSYLKFTGTSEITESMYPKTLASLHLENEFILSLSLKLTVSVNDQNQEILIDSFRDDKDIVFSLVRTICDP